MTQDSAFHIEFHTAFREYLIIPYSECNILIPSVELPIWMTSTRHTSTPWQNILRPSATIIPIYNITIPCLCNNNNFPTTRPPWISHHIKTSPPRQTGPSLPLRRKADAPSPPSFAPPLCPLTTRRNPLPTLGTRPAIPLQRRRLAAMTFRASARLIWRAVEEA